MAGVNVKLSLWLAFVHATALQYGKHMSRKTFRMNLVLWILMCVGITGGYHRLYTHGSYETVFPIRLLLLALGTAATENPVFEWASMHRMHHRFENIDKTLDPYSIQYCCDETCAKRCRRPTHMIRNFANAHMMWLTRKQTDRFKAEQEKVKAEMRDVEWKQDFALLKFQDKFYLPLMALSAFALPMYVSRKVFKDSWKSAVGGTFTRVVAVWHSTWFVNSLAHVMGDRPETTFTAANNHIVAALAFGEGYHNYHHAHPKDYYASKNLRGLNLTAWTLRTLKALRLVKNAKRAVLDGTNNAGYKYT